MVACSAERKQEIQKIWTERTPQESANGTNPALLNAEVLCPDESNLFLEGTKIFESNYQAIIIDYEYCFERNPLSQCSNKTEIDRVMAQGFLHLFVQSEFRQLDMSQEDAIKTSLDIQTIRLIK